MVSAALFLGDVRCGKAAEKRQEMEVSGLSMTEIAIQMKKLEHERGKKRHSRKGSFR